MAWQSVLVIALRTELEQLPSGIVARVHDACHELKDGELRRVCMDILWHRHATAGGHWRVSDEEIGAITLGDGNRAISRTREHAIAFCCQNGRGLSDESHRVKETLRWSYQDVGGRGAERNFFEIMCMCGARSDLPDRGGGLVLRRQQVVPDAYVWPVIRIPDINGGHPVFVVCKFAQHSEDAFHAPDSTGNACICGGALGIWNAGGSDRYLSVQ